MSLVSVNTLFCHWLYSHHNDFGCLIFSKQSFEHIMLSIFWCVKFGVFFQIGHHYHWTVFNKAVFLLSLSATIIRYNVNFCEQEKHKNERILSLELNPNDKNSNKFIKVAEYYDQKWN